MMMTLIGYVVMIILMIIFLQVYCTEYAIKKVFSILTVLVGQQEGHLACKNFCF